MEFYLNGYEVGISYFYGCLVGVSDIFLSSLEVGGIDIGNGVGGTEVDSIICDECGCGGGLNSSLVGSYKS